MPGCTAPWICQQWETTNEHCVEAAPCPHCRTDILQGVLTAPLRNYHCTSKAPWLKGQSCSKLTFTVLHGSCISHTLPVCWPLCVSVALVQEWRVWLTKITAEMVYFTNCVLQRKILKKNVVWLSLLKLPLLHESWFSLSSIALLPSLALDSFALWWSMERAAFWSFVY